MSRTKTKTAGKPPAPPGPKKRLEQVDGLLENAPDTRDDGHKLEHLTFGYVEAMCKSRYRNPFKLTTLTRVNKKLDSATALWCVEQAVAWGWCTEHEKQGGAQTWMPRLK